MGRKKLYKIFYPSARVHHLVIFVRDKNGNLMMTQERLLECIHKHDGAFNLFAINLHDSDVYDAEAVYINEEKNKKTFIDRLQVLSDAKGLAKDETTESGFVYDAELEQRAHEYADEQFPKIEVGQLKPVHWHVVFHFPINRNAGEIARWFKLLNGETLEPNWNEVKTGKTALPNALAYLIHAHDKNKFPYSKENVIASFDYVNEIDEQLAREEKLEKFHQTADDINLILERIGNDGLTLKDAKSILSNAVFYRNQQLLERARRDYVLNKMPIPQPRMCFYVDSEGIDDDYGRGGIGKTACAKAFAKQLAAEFGADVSKDINDLQEFIYIAGDAKVFLQDYDGQPIVLIDEINGVDFKRACKGVNGVKALLAPFPERKSIDKKHGAVVCAAKYIIVCGIQSFEAFKKDLAKESKIDGEVQKSEESVKEQFDRRFWGLLHLTTEQVLEILLNRGLFDKMPEQNVLTMTARVKANFRKLTSQLAPDVRAPIEAQIFRPLLCEVNDGNERYSLNGKISNVDDLTDDFLEMGQMLPLPDDDDFVEIVEQESIEEFFDVPDASNDAIHRIAWLVLADLAQREMIDASNSAVRSELLFAVERAIDWHFERKSFDDVKDREKRRLILKALDILSKMGVE